MPSLFPDRFAQKGPARGFEGLRSHRGFGIEALESRLQMSVTLTGLHAITDTGRSSTDSITYEAPIAGQLVGGQAEVRVDHNSDGQPEAQLSVYEGGFQYNPLAWDSSLQLWEGPLTLSFQLIEYDETGQPVAGGGGSFSYVLDRVPPHTVDIPDISVGENAQAMVIDLGAYFNDGCTADTNLIYSISNSNPGLFASTTLSGSTLTLNYAPNTAGSAVIEVSAADEAGLSSIQSFNVNVNSNPPPVITSFHGTPSPGQVWTFSGTVTDDKPVAGLTVSFGGILANHNLSATVQSDGSFTVTAYLPGLENGTATAITHDNQDKASNVATFFVYRIHGDMNGDGTIDNFDISPFEVALTDTDAYLSIYGLGDYDWRGDCDGDGVFDNFDISAFVELLMG